MQFLCNLWLLSGIVQCLEKKDLSNKNNSVRTSWGPKHWVQDSDGLKPCTLSQNFTLFQKYFQLQFWNQKAEGKKGTLEGKRVVYDVSLLMNYLFSGTATERPQGEMEQELKESAGTCWILHRSCSFDTGLPCTRPSIPCVALCWVEYAICMIRVIIITLSWATFSALWTGGRRDSEGLGFRQGHGKARGQFGDFFFILFCSGFQFLTLECISGL